MPRGKDGLYKRGTFYSFRYKDSDGAWREKRCGTNNREEARTFRDDFLSDIRTGILPNKMGDWRLDGAEQWWIEFRKLRTAENTQSSERYRLQHFQQILGNLKLKEITNRHLDDYVTARLAAGISAHSINKEIRLWSMVLRKAKLWKRLADDYRPLKTKASDIGQALTREQLRELAAVAATDVDWEAAFYGSVLAGNTGLRGGEIKKLRIGMIDLERRRLRIARADAKTDASARFIELNADATEAASRLLFRASKLKPPATEPNHYLLPKSLSRITHGKLKGGRGYDPMQYQRYWDSAWSSLTKAAGLKGIRFHDLRHTFITQMVERGIPLGVVQGMVGHMSARMLAHYTHIGSGAARRAVELLDADPVLAPLQTGREETVYRA